MGAIHSEPMIGGSPPRRWMTGFWVAGAVALAGVVAALAWALAAALSAVGSTTDLARAELPGTVRASVGAPQRVVVYYEGEPVPDPGRLALEVTGPGGRPVPLDPYRADLEYDSPVTPGTVGRAVASFEATRPGTYQVDSPFMPGATARLAVGDDVGRGFVQTLVGPALLAVGSALLASVIGFLTAVGINRRYREAASAGAR